MYTLTHINLKYVFAYRCILVFVLKTPQPDDEKNTKNFAAKSTIKGYLMLNTKHMIYYPNYTINAQ